MLHDRAAVRIGSSVGFSIGQTIGGLRGTLAPIAAWDALTSGGSGPSFLTDTRAGSATYFNSSQVMSSATNNVARIDYLYLTTPGLLAETSSRTNFALSSGDHSSASWTKVGVTATANATTAPDGTTTATKLAETAATSAHAEFNASGISITSGTTYTGSTFLQAAERNWVVVAIELGGVSYGKYINLSTGAIGSTFGSAPDSYAVFDVTGGRYRVIMTKAASSTGATGYISTYGALSDGGSVTYLGVAGSGYYRWGSQFEPGSFATSYTATSGTSVTRAPDTLTAALLTTNPAIIQYRSLSSGTRARKVINPWSGISSEADLLIEAARIYPSGTSAAYLNTKLTVDGAW